MAQHAFAQQDGLVASPNGDAVINLQVQYWEENGSSLVFNSDPIPVAVVVTSGMNAAQITSAAVDAVKAKATELFSWSLGANTVIVPSYNRG